MGLEYGVRVVGEWDEHGLIAKGGGRDRGFGIELESCGLKRGWLVAIRMATLPHPYPLLLLPLTL